MPAQMVSLLTAAELGDIEAVLALIRAGADVNARNCYGQTPLMLAAREGFCLVAMALIAKGANPALRSNASVTALQLAVATEQVDVVHFLIDVEIRLRRKQFAGLGVSKVIPSNIE